MKASRGDLGRALDRPDANIRLYLFHGPDESQSRGHGERLLKALGAERFVVLHSAVKSDPALLTDEAAAMNLFGGPRVIWIDGAGDEIAGGVGSLLSAPAIQSPVIVIAGSLRKTSALLKLAEGHRQVLAYASYPLEGGGAEQMVMDLGRTQGLRIDRSLAARIADACANDRGIAAQEVAKLALYVGASTESPRDLGHEALDAVGAEMAEGDWLRLADIALRGDVRALADELARLPTNAEPIPVIRALQRRLLMMAPLRARYRLVEIERGTVVLDATAGSDAGIDVVSSEYATVAAEQTALERLAEVVADQITARLGLFASRTAGSR